MTSEPMITFLAIENNNINIHIATLEKKAFIILAMFLATLGALDFTVVSK